MTSSSISLERIEVLREVLTELRKVLARPMPDQYEGDYPAMAGVYSFRVEHAIEVIDRLLEAR